MFVQIRPTLPPNRSPKRPNIYFHIIAPPSVRLVSHDKIILYFIAFNLNLRIRCTNLGFCAVLELSKQKWKKTVRGWFWGCPIPPKEAVPRTFPNSSSKQLMDQYFFRVYDASHVPMSAGVRDAIFFTYGAFEAESFIPSWWSVDDGKRVKVKSQKGYIN